VAREHAVRDRQQHGERVLEGAAGDAPTFLARQERESEIDVVGQHAGRVGHRDPGAGVITGAQRRDRLGCRAGRGHAHHERAGPAGMRRRRGRVLGDGVDACGPEVGRDGQRGEP
jgi:hypothetical protein